VIIQSISITNDEVTVRLITHGPNDGMCCPTVSKTLRMFFRRNKFVDSK
jgi:hypothetical protein